MQRLIYRSPMGKEATFQLEDPYVIWKVTGLAIPEADPKYTQSVSQSGYTLHDVLTDSRTITLTGHVIDSRGNIKNMYEMRKELMTVLNPELGAGTLIYTNDAGKAAIPAFCSGISEGDKNLFVHTLNIKFECPSPYFEDEVNTVVGLSYVEGGLKFPLKTPNKFGTLDYRAVVVNSGGLPIPIEIFIQGGAVEPVITNKTTGEFIHIEKDTTGYQNIYINTDPNNLAVELITSQGASETRENAYGYLSFESNLFLLQPGSCCTGTVLL